MADNTVSIFKRKRDFVYLVYLITHLPIILGEWSFFGLVLRLFSLVLFVKVSFDSFPYFASNFEKFWFLY